MHGVASNANLVLVKHKNGAINPGGQRPGFRELSATAEAIEAAWSWVITDVKDRRSKGDKGMSIVNLSAGK